MDVTCEIFYPVHALVPLSWFHRCHWSDAKQDTMAVAAGLLLSLLLHVHAGAGAGAGSHGAYGSFSVTEIVPEHRAEIVEQLVEHGWVVIAPTLAALQKEASVDAAARELFRLDTLPPRRNNSCCLVLPPS